MVHIRDVALLAIGVAAGVIAATSWGGVSGSASPRAAKVMCKVQYPDGSQHFTPCAPPYDFRPMAGTWDGYAGPCGPQDNEHAFDAIDDCDTWLWDPKP